MHREDKIKMSFDAMDRDRSGSLAGRCRLTVSHLH